MTTPRSTDERTEILYEASRLLSAPLQLSSGLDRVFAGVMHRYELNACAVFVENGGGPLRCAFAAGLSQEMTRTLTVQPGQGASGVAFSSARARHVQTPAELAGDPLLSALQERLKIQSSLSVPLSTDGRALGVAVYASRKPDAFSPERMETLEQFTVHLALAVRNHEHVQAVEEKNRRLEKESTAMVQELHQTNRQLVRKVRELKTIYDLALATAASSNIEDIARVIIQGVKELVEAQTGAFFLLGEGGLLEPIAPAFDRVGAEAAALTCRTEQSAALERAVNEGKTEILHFLEGERLLPSAWDKLAIRSMLILPLKQDNRVKGVFCVINKTNGLFSEDDVRLLSLMTHRVADVLERLTLDQQLRQRVHDLSVLQEMGVRLPSPPMLSDTVSAIARSTRQAIPGLELCLFFVHHPESETLVVMGGDWDSGLAIDPQPLTTGASEKVPVAEAFHDGRPSVYEKGSSSAAWKKDGLIQNFALQQLYYLPLTVEHGPLGVMALGTRRPEGLGLEGKRLGQMIANQVAVIVERSRLFERLRHANQKLEQINNLKNEFISMVSHELRTPLTTIKGFVSIVLNEETGDLNKQQKHFLETSDRAIDRLTLLVSDLLDISRMEAGQIKMQLRPSVLKDVLVAWAKVFLQAAARRHRDDAFHPERLERKNIRPVIHFRGVHAMTTAVPGQKRNALAI